jgi:two-component system cell cycle response regulator
MEPSVTFTTTQTAFPSNVSEHTFKVLVADDSPIYRKLVENTLAPKHYELLFAKTGAEAMNLLSQHQPSLVITDWMMPDLNGIELCEHIRSHPQLSYTYIIILTGVTEKNKVVKGLEAGADDYLTKPFHSDELLARVGVGLRIVKLHRQLAANSRLLEELALTDALTGLPNRRAIEEWAPRQLSGAIRHGFSFWVVMADLDLFKSVNDSNGHEAGDAVLKTFAHILKENSRASDMCGRIGGEEFLIVLSHTDEKGALIVVQRMREEMAAHKFQFGAKEVVVTASFGIAEYSCNQDQNFARLVAQADAAMYSAKQHGRNRVEVARLAG